MSRVQAFSIYRTCAASFSARHAVRRSAQRAFVGARYYSEGQAQADDASTSQKGEEKAAKSSTETECLEKLKQKETEVTDLTVRPPPCVPLTPLTWILGHRDGYDTFRQTS